MIAWNGREEVKQHFAAEQGVPIQKLQNIWEGDSSLGMTVDNTGSPDSIYFCRTNVLAEPVGKDEVLIKVEATGVSYRDLLPVLGHIPWTPPDLEGVGVATRAGQLAELKPEYPVFYCALGGGGFAIHLRMPSSCAFKVSKHITSVDAASIPITYCAAVTALIRIGRRKKGENLLIHAASGPVGQACIVLAKHLGGIVFATAGTDAKREFLHKTFAIPKAHIFSGRISDFKDRILCATGNKGIDVIINSLNGNLLQEPWPLIAEFGRFLEIGKRVA